VFDDEVDAIAKGGSRQKALERIDADHDCVRFYLPIRAKDPETQDTWSVIRSLSSKIGEELTRIIRKIATNNNPQFKDQTGHQDELIKNDYNIFPSRYIHLGGVEEYRPVEDILAELVEVEAKAKAADKNLSRVLKGLGF
jgi:hypothetical protein